MWQSSSFLLLFIGIAGALSVKTDGTAEQQCKLPVKECPIEVKGLEIQSVMIPGCCEWPCSLHKNISGPIIIEFHTNDNYTTILQRICLDILCNKTSGTTTDFTNVCEFLITCPLEAGRNYQITEHVNSNAPNIHGLFILTFYGNSMATSAASVLIPPSIGCLQMDLSIVQESKH